MFTYPDSIPSQQVGLKVFKTDSMTPYLPDFIIEPNLTRLKKDLHLCKNQCGYKTRFKPTRNTLPEIDLITRMNTFTSVRWITSQFTYPDHIPSQQVRSVWWIISQSTYRDNIPSQQVGSVRWIISQSTYLDYIPSQQIASIKWIISIYPDYVPSQPVNSKSWTRLK